MNTKLIQVRFLVPAAMGLITACSGGDINISAEGPDIQPFPPSSSSEAITAHGVIKGSGGVTINDVTYTANDANITINGQPGNLSGLRQGQVVTLTGRINADGHSGTADSIVFDADLIGPVEGLDAANNRLIAMGQTVVTDSETRFGTGIDPATYVGLSVGANVRISGYRDASGVIRATWIDSATAGAELQLIGKVAGLDLANLVFTINWLTLDYSGAIVIDIPGGAPANGTTVKAIGTMAGGLFHVERLVSVPGLSGSAGQRAQVAGVITRFNSPSDFDINGSAAAVDTGTAYFNGSAGDLGLNAELVIDGDFAASGRITVSRVSFGRFVGETSTLVFGFKDFTEISVPTVFNVMVTRGSDFSVEVTIDTDDANRVEVTQTGSRLNIVLLSGGGEIRTLEARVTMPVLERIDLTGVVNAMLYNFNQTHMTANIGGVSRLHGNNLTIDNLTASVSGVSQLSFGDIRPIGTANINVSGVSQATLNMDVGATLAGSVATGQGTGVSTLFYYGTNVNVNVTTGPNASVVRLGPTRP